MPHLLMVGQAFSRWRSQWRPNSATYVQGLCAGVLLGLLAKSGLSINQVTLLIIGGLFAPFALARRYIGVVGFCLIGISLGAARAPAVWGGFESYDQYVGSNVVITGQAVETDAYNEKGQTEFIIDHVKIESDPLPGKVQVTTYDAVQLDRGDEVMVEGVLRERFGNRAGYIYYAEVTKTVINQSSVESWRQNFIAGIYSALPDPEASLGLGFLLGTRVLLPESLTSQLSITGLTHIVAVSGYNLTILVRLARRVFAKYSAYLAVAASAILIITFLLLTGLVPSIFRASVVTGLSLAAWFYGRQVSPITLLLVSAAFTAFIRPQFYWFDLGWWLSFLSFIGVLILAPLLFSRFFHTNKPPLFLQVLIETSAAQIMALPLIGMVFGEISVIAIIANVFILPLIPLAMTATAVAGVAGTYLTPIAGWLAWPAEMLLSLITSLIQLFSKVPFALAQVEYQWPLLVSLYSIVLLVMAVMFVALRRSDKELAHGYNVVE